MPVNKARTLSCTTRLLSGRAQPGQRLPCLARQESAGGTAAKPLEQLPRFGRNHAFEHFDGATNAQSLGALLRLLQIGVDLLQDRLRALARLQGNRSAEEALQFAD